MWISESDAKAWTKRRPSGTLWLDEFTYPVDSGSKVALSNVLTLLVGYPSLTVVSREVVWSSSDSPMVFDSFLSANACPNKEEPYVRWVASEASDQTSTSLLCMALMFLYDACITSESVRIELSHDELLAVQCTGKEQMKAIRKSLERVGCGSL